MRHASGLVALVSIVLCVLAPVLFFLGSIPEATYHALFAVGSVVWFVSAVIWVSGRKKAQ